MRKARRNQDDSIDPYVFQTRRIHYLISSLEDLLKNREYVVFFDTNVFCGFHHYLEVHSHKEIDKSFLSRIKIFLTHFFRIVDNYRNLCLIPPIKEEMLHLIDACISACKHRIDAYGELPFPERDRYVDVHNPICEIAQLLDRLRGCIVEHSYRPILRHTIVIKQLLALVEYLNHELKLKKPSLTANNSDEQLVAEIFHNLLVNQRLAAVYSRDSDVHRLVSTVFKVFVSTDVKDEETEYIQNTLFFRNLMLLRYRAEKEAWTRAFETTGQIPSRDFGVHPVSEKRRRKIVKKVKSGLAQIYQELNELDLHFVEERPKPTEEEIEEAAETLLSQLQKMHGNDSSATPDQIADCLRAYKALSVMHRATGSRILEVPLKQAIDGRTADLLRCHLQTLRERSEELKADLSGLTRDIQNQLDLDDTERLREVATLLSDNRTEILFFEAALAEGLVHYTNEHYQKMRELQQRFESNGYELGERSMSVHPREVAYITGIPYTRLVKLVSERHIPVVDNALSLQLWHLVHFV